MPWFNRSVIPDLMTIRALKLQKMKVLFCLITFSLSFLSCKISGQNLKTKKWEFSLSSGLSIPVASYGKKDPARSAIYIIGAPLPSVKGFDKGKSGFAKTGFEKPLFRCLPTFHDSEYYRNILSEIYRNNPTEGKSLVCSMFTEYACRVKFISSAN